MCPRDARRESIRLPRSAPVESLPGGGYDRRQPPRRIRRTLPTTKLAAHALVRQRIMHVIGHRTRLAPMHPSRRARAGIKRDEEQRRVAGSSATSTADRASAIARMGSSHGVQATRPDNQPERLVPGSSSRMALVDGLGGVRDGLIERASGQGELGPGLSQTQPPQPLVPTRGARRGRPVSSSSSSARPGSWLRAKANNASMFALTIGGANPTSSPGRALRTGALGSAEIKDVQVKSRRHGGHTGQHREHPVFRPKLRASLKASWPRRSVPSLSDSTPDARANT